MKNRYDKYGCGRDLTISLGVLACCVVQIWSYFFLCHQAEEMPSYYTSPYCSFRASLLSSLLLSARLCSLLLFCGLNQVKMYWLVITEAVRESESPVSRAHSQTPRWDQQSNLTHYSFIKFPEVCVLGMHQYYDNTDAGCVQSSAPK